MVEKNCKFCSKPHSVRQADLNRGWGQFCSKSCKAKQQEKKNGQHAAYITGRGVSNLHPERLKKDLEYDDYVSHVTGKKCDPFDEDGYGFTGDDHGQWED